MVDFIPPPPFTTVRFDPRLISKEDTIKSLSVCVLEDIKNRHIPSSHNVTGLEVECHPLIPDVLLIPVLSLQGVKPYPREIIVDRSCGMAVLRGAHVFAPGIIGAPQSLKVGDLVSVIVDLEGKCLKGSMTSLESKHMFIGNGIAEVSRNQLFTSSSKVCGIGIRMNEPLYLSPCLDQGTLPLSCFLQNLPSIVVGHVLAPRPDDIILDMCAAPGGKSTHICALLQGKGHVIALDRSKAKTEKIRRNAEHLGCSDILSVFATDSRNIVSDSCNEMAQDFAPPYPPQSFTHILLDAPCSALGQRPRFPENNTRTGSTIASYPALQWKLFKVAVTLLKPGGTLVYSTCTTTHEENEGMVERALKQYPNIHLVEQVPHIGQPGRTEQSKLSLEQFKLLQYFPMFPFKDTSRSHPADGDTIGFFIAKFTKSSVNTDEFG